VAKARADVASTLRTRCSWRMEKMLGCVEHHGGVCERMRRVGKLLDPSGGACRRVEAWTVEISSNLDSERLICRLGRCVQHQNGLRLHRSIDPRPRHHFWWFFWPRGVSVVTR
jgi:hypothetical protein